MAVEEFDLPLRVKRRRTANADTVEWRLVLGEQMVAYIFAAPTMDAAWAVPRLFAEVQRAVAEC